MRALTSIHGRLSEQPGPLWVEDPALQGGGGTWSFHFNSGALGLLNWVPTNLLQPGPPDCVTLLLRTQGSVRLGCLVSREPLWPQGAGDVDMPEAAAVHSEGAQPPSVLITPPGNARAERPVRWRP